MEPTSGDSHAIPSPPGDVPALVEHLFRHQAGQLIATLTRRFGVDRLELAEDVVQETMIKALGQWAYHGVPANPRAWLIRVARNLALDILRRQGRFAGAPLLDDLWADQQAALAMSDREHELADDSLRLIFLCCHPVLPREAQVALTLKLVGGFGTGEIAQAFLTSETTIAQRLVRAKRTLRTLGESLELPQRSALAARLEPVLDVLYLLFNAGYSAHQGEQLVRTELCAEALRLVTLVAAHPLGDQPQVHALRALMLLHAARLPARTDAHGEMVLLSEQDRSRWDRQLLVAGMEALAHAASGERLSTYHLQAGIAACHAVAPSYAATNWKRIVAQYDALFALSPSPVVALNRAIAVAMLHNSEAGLAALTGLEQVPQLQGYPFYYAARGELLRRQGDHAGAAEQYRRALAHSRSAPEERLLRRKLAACDLA